MRSDGRLLFADTGHLDQQDSHAADGAAGKGGLLTANPHDLQAGLMLEEVEAPFAIFTQLLSFLYVFGTTEHPLEPAAIQRNETIFPAVAAIDAFSRSCLTFLLVAPVMLCEDAV